MKMQININEYDKEELLNKIEVLGQAIKIIQKENKQLKRQNDKLKKIAYKMNKKDLIEELLRDM